MVMDFSQGGRRANSVDVATNITNYIANHKAVDWPLILTNADYPKHYEITVACTFAVVLALILPWFIANGVFRILASLALNSSE